MKILIGCEYSAAVRDAFRARGHDAWSCDMLPTEGDPKWHLVGDIVEVLSPRFGWDAIILHIPCTAMGVCGNSTYAEGSPRHTERLEAIEWSMAVWELAKQASPKVALENPASVIFPHLRKTGADVQYVHPWQFGHPEQKKTGLALHNLPRLVPTNDVYEHMMTLPKHERERVHYMSPGPDRGKERARFYTGFAEAMADQWGLEQMPRHPHQLSLAGLEHGRWDGVVHGVASGLKVS